MSITIRRSLVLLVSVLVVVAGLFVVQRANAASSTPVVYVATGENFPDARGAAGAAAVQGGPILLVQQNSIPEATRGELSRLKPDVIYVAGGSDVVSDAVFDALKAYAPSVIRVEGRTRYETAVEVSKSAFPATGGGGTAALEARIAELEALLAGVTRNGTTLEFSGMNLQVVNGTGSTEGPPNSLGNVIIGYNEDFASSGTEARIGSHYLILGIDNDWTTSGGIVAGFANTASGRFSSVTGGANNTAIGVYSSVTGGANNTAWDSWSAVTGGYGNTASSQYASVTGGHENAAIGNFSSVSGGGRNTASGIGTSILGNKDRIESGDYVTRPG
jgi:hypothetical protein